MAIATSPDTTAPGWLRSRSFDLTFIVGVAALAIASGWLVVNDPRLFAPILLLDLWLLGYHHVIATYTRLCFDRASFKRTSFSAASACRSWCWAQPWPWLTASASGR